MYILPKFLLQYSSYYTLKIHSPLKHFCKIGINPLHNYTVKWSEMKSLSRVRLFSTPWTVAHQAPLSMGFSRQKYWSGLPCFSPGDLADPGIEPGSPALQADCLPTELPRKPILFFFGAAYSLSKKCLMITSSLQKEDVYEVCCYSHNAS